MKIRFANLVLSMILMTTFSMSAEAKINVRQTAVKGHSSKAFKQRKRCAQRCKRNNDRKACMQRCFKRAKKQKNDTSCCRYPIAKCRACEAKMSKLEYCSKRPETRGCPIPRDLERHCCKARTATCLACNAKMSVEDYCKAKPKTLGCSRDKPRLCCKALTAKCLACAQGMSVDAFCRQSPSTQGCKSANVTK